MIILSLFIEHLTEFANFNMESWLIANTYALVDLQNNSSVTTVSRHQVGQQCACLLCTGAQKAVRG